MPSTTIASQTSTHTIELAVTDAPPLTVEVYYYTVTGLRITYTNDIEAWMHNPGALEAYEMVQPWIRDEVDKHRPAQHQNAAQAQSLNDVADKLTFRDATRLWDQVNNVLLGYGFYNPANSVPETEKVFALFRQHLRDAATA